jgi:hypothetical protein
VQPIHPNNQLTGTLPRRARYVAIAAGFFSAASAALGLGVLAIVLPAFLLGTAILEPYVPRTGKWLIWIIAFILSVYTLPIGVMIIRDGISTLRPYHDPAILGILASWLLTLFFLIWCDAELILDAYTSRKFLSSVNQNASPNRDWIAAIGAVILSALFLPATIIAITTLHLHHRLGLLLPPLIFSFIVISFDVAVAAQIIKSRRSKRLNEAASRPK